MSDAIVQRLKILVILIVLLCMVQAYFISQHFNKNLITSMIQTNSSLEKIRTWMNPNFTSNSGSETDVGSGGKLNYSTLTVKSLTHGKYIVQNVSNVKEPVLTIKGTQSSEQYTMTLPLLTEKGIIMNNYSSELSNGSTPLMLPCIRGIDRQSGPIKFNFTTEKLLTYEKTNLILKRLSKDLTDGGRYKPPNCEPKQRIAIIIPYRDREEHLKIFLRHMHPYLQRQKLEYGIFVIELDKNITFNRAILMNIGFVEALKLQNYTCFVFHDVDLLPEDARIPYSCARNPLHLSVAVDTLKYRLPNKRQFGGVTAMRTEQFIEVNGMSNMFFGWGGEDDDLSERVRSKNYNISRPPKDIARYKMIGHVKDPDRNPHRRCLLKSVKDRMKRDGIVNLKYKRISLELRPLYTWVLVRVNETEQLTSDSYLFQFFDACANEVHNNGAGTLIHRSKPLLVVVIILCYIFWRKKSQRCV